MKFPVIDSYCMRIKRYSHTHYVYDKKVTESCTMSIEKEDYDALVANGVRNETREQVVLESEKNNNVRPRVTQLIHQHIAYVDDVHHSN